MQKTWYSRTCYLFKNALNLFIHSKIVTVRYLTEVTLVNELFSMKRCYVAIIKCKISAKIISYVLNKLSAYDRGRAVGRLEARGSVITVNKAM